MLDTLTLPVQVPFPAGGEEKEKKPYPRWSQVTSPQVPSPGGGRLGGGTGGGDITLCLFYISFSPLPASPRWGEVKDKTPAGGGEDKNRRWGQEKDGCLTE